MQQEQCSGFYCAERPEYTVFVFTVRREGGSSVSVFIDKFLFRGTRTSGGLILKLISLGYDVSERERSVLCLWVKLKTVEGFTGLT